MLDLISEILDEAIWGLHAKDSVEAIGHVENIRDLVEHIESTLEANEIPEEVRVV